MKINLLKKVLRKTEAELKEETSYGTHQRFLTKKQAKGFEKLLNRNASETEIDNYLTKNPVIFTSALHNFRTGHHGTIVIPKQSIRPKIKTTQQRGLIPDFIIGGDSSSGWEWWVVELKGTQQNTFTKKDNDIYFNSEINKGICQLLEYIDFCNENQANLRDNFNLENFREPGGILISGREDEFSDEGKRRMKSAWNRATHGKLEIRTYDWILRNLNHMLELNGEL